MTKTKSKTAAMNKESIEDVLRTTAEISHLLVEVGPLVRKYDAAKVKWAVETLESFRMSCPDHEPLDLIIRNNGVAVAKKTKAPKN